MMVLIINGLGAGRLLVAVCGCGTSCLQSPVQLAHLMDVKGPGSVLISPSAVSVEAMAVLDRL